MELCTALRGYCINLSGGLRPAEHDQWAFYEANYKFQISTRTNAHTLHEREHNTSKQNMLETAACKEGKQPTDWLDQRFWGGNQRLIPIIPIIQGKNETKNITVPPHMNIWQIYQFPFLQLCGTLAPCTSQCSTGNPVTMLNQWGRLGEPLTLSLHCKISV